MRKRLLLIPAAAVVTGLAIIGSGPLADRLDPASVPPPDPPRPGAAEPQSTMTRAQARAFQPFTLYNLGESHGDLPLVALLYGGKGNPAPEEGEPIAPHDVTFVYGDCDPSAYDGGCAPPLQVQVWPACRRNPAVIDLAPDETVRVRGRTGYFYDLHSRLEITTGRSTVVLFAGDRGGPEARAFLLDAAKQLRGVNIEHGPPVDLPAPAQGALAGGLSCQPEE